MTAPTNHDAEVIRRASRDGAEAHNAVAKAQGYSVSYGHAVAEGLTTNPHDCEGADSRLHSAFAVGYGWACLAYGMGVDHAFLPLMVNAFGDFGPISDGYALGWAQASGEDRRMAELNGIARPANHGERLSPEADLLRRKLAVAEEVQAAALSELDGNCDALARIKEVADESSDTHGTPYMVMPT